MFAQRSNLLRPRFLGMLAQILRFNRLATGIAEAGDEASMAEPIGDFLARHRFGEAFRDWYLLPMLGCIWSCPTDQMLRFPVATMIRFCHNHGLIQVSDRPQWHTVVGGSRVYVQKMLASIPDARLRTPVRARARACAGGAIVATDAGSEHFDEVVLACHSDQALALLADASDDERALLGAIRYQPNRAVLHTDDVGAAAAQAGLGGLELRTRGADAARAVGGVPALPDQPAAAAALDARRWWCR